MKRSEGRRFGLPAAWSAATARRVLLSLAISETVGPPTYGTVRCVVCVPHVSASERCFFGACRAYGNLGINPGEEVLEMYAQHCIHKINEFTPQNLSNVVSAPPPLPMPVTAPRGG